MTDLIVEDGTGLSNSDSFISLADATIYMSNMGYTDWASMDEDSQNAQLRRASLFLATYSFIGLELKPETQALCFPRYIPLPNQSKPNSTTIPQAVKNAQCELAMIDDLGSATNGTIEKMTKVDVIEIEYDTTYAAPTDNYPMVESILRKLLTGEQSNDFASMRSVSLRKAY